jgi:hypothetical protein
MSNNIHKARETRDSLFHMFRSVMLIMDGELERIWKEAARESNARWRQEAPASRYETRNSGIGTKKWYMLDRNVDFVAVT